VERNFSRKIGGEGKKHFRLREKINLFVYRGRPCSRPWYQNYWGGKKTSFFPEASYKKTVPSGGGQKQRPMVLRGAQVPCDQGVSLVRRRGEMELFPPPVAHETWKKESRRGIKRNPKPHSIVSKRWPERWRELPRD